MEETADFISSLGLSQYHNTFIGKLLHGREQVGYRGGGGMGWRRKGGGEIWAGDERLWLGTEG